jgi:hypothetical protein
MSDFFLIFSRTEDDDLNQELSFTDRAQKREIRRLEQEISQWEVMLEKSGYVEGNHVFIFKAQSVFVNEMAYFICCNQT